VKVALVLGLAFIGLFAIWRFFWFFRDPERIAPPGDDVLSPADGFVIYVHPIRAGEVPIAMKGRRSIRLEELLGISGTPADGFLIGIYMSVFDVHVNRSPIRGIVGRRRHLQGRRNRTMGRMFANLLIGRRPYAENSRHLVENERNTVVIEGDGLVAAVTQIADAWANRIVCRLAEGDRVERGERIGLIRMGSQVDVFLAGSDRVAITPVCRERQHVRAGESVLARVDRRGEALSGAAPRGASGEAPRDPNLGT